MKFLKPPPTSGMIIKMEQGFKLQIDPIYDKGIERRLYQHGTYEAGTLWFLEKIIKSGDIIIDIGANIGLISIFAGKLTGITGRVYSFEPFPTTFQILIKNIHLNNSKNVFAYPLALSNYKGKGTIFPNLHINRGAASLNKNSVSQKPSEVEVTTLGHWLKEEEISKVDLIKIDVEGLEFEVLQGAAGLFKEGNRPIICLEYSQEVISDHEKHELFNFLKNTLGYKIFIGQKGKEIPSKLIEIKKLGDLPKHDNIYCFSNKRFTELSEDLFVNSYKI